MLNRLARGGGGTLRLSAIIRSALRLCLCVVRARDLLHGQPHLCSSKPGAVMEVADALLGRIAEHDSHAGFVQWSEIRVRIVAIRGEEVHFLPCELAVSAG